MKRSFDALVAQYTSSPVTEYAMVVTMDGEHWYTMSSKWYTSANKAIAAYKATPYADITKFKEIRILERESVCTIKVSQYK